MILSIFSEPDARVPRLAAALARFRRQASRSVAMLDWTSPTESASSGILVRRRRSAEIEVSTATSRYQDVVVDVDDLFSPSAISAWIAARTAVIALSPAFALDPISRDKLIARFERSWLFNPRLKILLLPVCLGAEPSPAHLAAVKNLAGTVSCVRMANTCIHDLRKLKAPVDGVWEDKICRELVALWNEIDGPST